jgi:hypothetical protein
MKTKQKKSVIPKEIIIVVLFFAGIIALALGVAYILNAPMNAYWNNQDKITADYEFHSYAVGMAGHVEYTHYTDGYTYIEDHSWWGSSTLGYRAYTDRNADGNVDIITEHGSGTTFFRMKRTLTREMDYSSDKQEFDDADKLLVELNKKYRK